MKKIFVYTILLWTMLLISSCVQPLDVPENIRYDGTFGIDLSVVCSAPGTKVVESEKPGVDSLNENKLSHVDWFIFKSDSEASLDSALLHGRADANDIVQASTSDGLQTENIKLKGPILMDDLVSDSQRSFYVYTIANLPSDYSHNDIGTKTLAELKALPIVANFNVNPFVKQNNFVMQGGQAFTFENSDQGNLKKVTAELKRSAAKVTINMNIAPAIDQMTTLPTGGRQYVKTWYPSLGDVQVYLSFANDSTTLEGVPQQYNIKNFFTYNRAAFKPAYSYVNAAGGSQVVTPGGSVPTVTPAWDNSNWKWNVTGTPFYSYPMSWTSDSPQAPFLKVILKWTSYKEDESSFVYDNEGKFLRTGRNPSTSQMIDAAKEFYYKIPIPAEVLNSNEWYHLTFAVDILGSTADELPVELGGRYCVVDWSNSNVQAGGNLNQGRYLDIASDTFYIYGVDNIKIPVISSHDIAVSVTGVTYNDYSNYTSGQTYPTPRSGFNNFPFNIAGRDASAVPNGRQEFSFSHHVIDINSAGTGDNRPDVSDYTFTVLVYHKDLYPENVPSENQPYVKKVTIIQQPPLRIKSETNTYTDGGHVFVNNNTSNNQQWNSVTGRLGTGQNNNPNMYIVSTSVAPEGRVIADPRSTVEDRKSVV